MSEAQSNVEQGAPAGTIDRGAARDGQSRRYVVITPARDEEDFAERTLRSMERQTRPPDLWVVVDDGSSDRTPAILEAWKERLPYLRVVRREKRQERSVGPGVIDTFYAGLETVDIDGFTYLCKLDLDLDLPPRYFETMIERMERDERLGTCSGKAYYPGPDGDLISEGVGDEMSVGAMKFYRTSCFQQIGGFVRQVMWDGIDCHRARMLGWRAQSWDEEQIRVVHLRPMVWSHIGIWTGRKRHGFGQHFMGTGLAYMSASAISRLGQRPVVVGAIANWWGFVQSMLRREKRLDDPEFRVFLRRYQWSALLRGKRRAFERIERDRAGRFHPQDSTRWSAQMGAAA